jgi:hypothetical protein
MMRGLLGLVGLLLVLVVAGMLVRKQMATIHAPLPGLNAPAGEVAKPPMGNSREQSQQIQQQYKQALEGAMQKQRPAPDEQ